MRFVTLNLWGARPPLERRLDVIAEGLIRIAPDVVMLQEVRVAADIANTSERLADMLGEGWRAAYVCCTRGEAGLFGPGSTAGEEGLAVLARHDVAETRSCSLPEGRPDEQRRLLSALISGSEGRVWVHTTHLHWRLGDGLARERQVLAIDDEVRAIAAGASDTLHVLGGDFNAAPDCDEIRFLRGRHTLEGRRCYWQDAYQAVHPDERGFTWARKNPMTEHLAWLERDRRIDYLFVGPERRDGRGKVLDARVILDEPAADGTWPSDHFGLMADLKIG